MTTITTNTTHTHTHKHAQVPPPLQVMEVTAVQMEEPRLGTEAMAGTAGMGVMAVMGVPTGLPLRVHLAMEVVSNC